MIRLYNGDCLEIMKDIPDESVDLLLTDIPYNISKDSGIKSMGKNRNGLDFGEWDKDFDVSKLSIFTSKIKKGGSFILFYGYGQDKIIQVLGEQFTLKDRIVWQKTNPMPRNRDRRYISNVEFALWFVKNGKKWTFNRQHDTYDGCVMSYPSESGSGYKRYHPCQKNVKMLEELVLRHSNKGDTILDPFMGSGSTGIACLNTNRDFIGIELDKSYFDIAKNRIEEAKSND